MSPIYDCSKPDSRAAGLAAAAGAVRNSRLVVLPTDTLYGIGCDAFDPGAVNDLLAAKNRGPEMPVPVLVGSWNTIDGLVASVTPSVRELTRAFWPGALSIVARQVPSLQWNLGNTAGTVMVRMPLHPVAIELLRELGPMAVSSANKSGQPPATTVAEAQAQLGDEVAVYLDGGPAAHAVASTIIDVSGPGPKVLREGAISVERIAEVLAVAPDTLR